MILLQNRSYGIDDNILKSKNYKNRFNKKLYPEGLKRKCVDFNLHTRTSPESACSCTRARWVISPLPVACGKLRTILTCELCLFFHSFASICKRYWAHKIFEKNHFLIVVMKYTRKRIILSRQFHSS